MNRTPRLSKSGYGWDANPWDFALTFKVVE